MHRHLPGGLAAREIHEMSICLQKISQLKQLRLLMLLYRREDGINLSRDHPVLQFVDHLKLHKNLLCMKLERYQRVATRESGQAPETFEDQSVEDLKQRIFNGEGKLDSWEAELKGVDRRMAKIRRGVFHACGNSANTALTKEGFRAAILAQLFEIPFFRENARKSLAHLF